MTEARKCEKCGASIQERQRAIYRDGLARAHYKCPPSTSRGQADADDLAIDDWKLNKK